MAAEIDAPKVINGADGQSLVQTPATNPTNVTVPSGASPNVQATNTAKLSEPMKLSPGQTIAAPPGTPMAQAAANATVLGSGKRMLTPEQTMALTEGQSSIAALQQAETMLQSPDSRLGSAPYMVSPSTANFLPPEFGFTDKQQQQNSNLATSVSEAIKHYAGLRGGSSGAAKEMESAFNVNLFRDGTTLPDNNRTALNKQYAEEAAERTDFQALKSGLAQAGYDASKFNLPPPLPNANLQVPNVLSNDKSWMAPLVNPSGTPPATNSGTQGATQPQSTPPSLTSEDTHQAILAYAQSHPNDPLAAQAAKIAQQNIHPPDQNTPTATGTPPSTAPSAPMTSTFTPTNYNPAPLDPNNQ